MGSFWLWGWWFFLTLPDRLSCPLFIYMVHFEFEFTRLFGFIQDTIENELVSELDFILDYDKAKLAVRDIVDMPDRLIDLFIRLCIENKGRLSKNKRKTKFEQLTDKEVAQMEARVRNAFNRTATDA